MHIYRNVLAEYQKIKKAKENWGKRSGAVRIYVEGLQIPSTKTERSQEVTLTPTPKSKFKSDLAEKKQRLSKTNKILLEQSKHLENMKNQLVTRQASVESLEKEMEKEYSQNQYLSFDIAKVKSETLDTVKLQKDLHDY